MPLSLSPDLRTGIVEGGQSIDSHFKAAIPRYLPHPAPGIDPCRTKIMVVLYNKRLTNNNLTFLYCLSTSFTAFQPAFPGPVTALFAVSAVTFAFPMTLVDDVIVFSADRTGLAFPFALLGATGFGVSDT